MKTDLHGLLTRALRALRHEPRTKNQWTRKQAIERAQARQDLFQAIGDLEVEMRRADSCPLCRELSIECLCGASQACPVFSIGPRGMDDVCATCGLEFSAHSKFTPTASSWRA
jgi:hypothetical protein